MKYLKALALLSILSSGVCGYAQSIYPGIAQEKIKLPIKGDVKAESFNLKDVRLLDSRFHDNMRRDSAWLASLSTDRLLHSFRTTAGVPAGREGGYMTVKKLGGWESLDCELRGHTTGHVMSALAQMYAATGDLLMKAKGDSIVKGLRVVQEAHGNGYISAFPEELINRNIKGTSVWAPWYTLHKILSGLIDQYIYADNQEALEVATDMGKWASAKLKDIDEPTRLKMLRNEFGGINEAFYNLYSITADPDFLSVAEFFYHPDVIDPLKRGNADLGTKHTNTFIPKVLGEMRRYELTGDEESLNLSRFFWDEMLAHHTFAPGCSSDKEHYFKPEEFSKHISGYTGETCCTYNMLKLSRHMFCNNPDSRVMDYYERALYNHILGQQDPETGMVAYFLPLATGTHRVYSTPENSFWCCVGSGFENHSKYGEQIYSKTGDGLLVNLFIPSQLDWSDKGIKVTQLTDFPASSSTKLKIETENPTKSKIGIRIPAWSKMLAIKVNGKKINPTNTSSGYAMIDRIWKDGDQIEVDFNMNLIFEPTPDGSGLGALVYGPIVMAARLGTEGMESPAPYSNPSLYNDYYTYDYHIPAGLPDEIDIKNLKKTGPLTFVTVDGLTIEPLYDIHRERYGVYWKEKM